MFDITFHRKGFTLIELMIVIIVIAILALLVIPKLAGASRKARESSMRSHLQVIRNALEQFQGDVGSYPTSSLGDLTLSLSAGSASYAGYKGPYLKQSAGQGIGGSGIPYNPTTARSDVMTDNWSYAGNPEGDIHPANQAGLSTIDDNVAYSAL